MSKYHIPLSNWQLCVSKMVVRSNFFWKLCVHLHPDYWRNCFIKFLLSYGIDLCLSVFMSDYFVFVLTSFNSIHLLSYTRDPWWKDIISFQQWLQITLLRKAVKKKKRKFFLFEMTDLWEHVILLRMCKYQVNIAFKNLLLLCLCYNCNFDSNVIFMINRLKRQDFESC